jgi:hypothetical protein
MPQLEGHLPLDYEKPLMDRAIPFPGHFLVGAPRCGTTSMGFYLRNHPEVCFSDPKEPHFFSYLWRQRPPRDIHEEYVKRYFGAYDPRHHRVLCEASVSYLYDRSALERILHCNPGARFLVMVRDPFDQLPSYHQQMLYLLQEDVPSLAEAWQLQERRARGEALPTGCIDPDLLRYAEVGRLGAAVSQLFELAGRERCHVVVFDDLISDPRAVYLGVLDFMGLEDDGRREFPRRGKGKRYRKPPGTIVRRVAPWVIRFRGRNGMRSRWLRWLRRRLGPSHVSIPAPALAPELQRVLRRDLAADVALLERLLGRHLGPWLGGHTERRPTARARPEPPPSRPMAREAQPPKDSPK